MPKGKLVLPGGVDPHVHLDLPMPGTVSSDDHYTGTKAAAFGGTTTVIDFANHDRPSLVESFNTWQEKAVPNVAVDYGIHQNFTRFNEDTLTEISLLPDLGVTSVKMFTAYNGRDAAAGRRDISGNAGGKKRGDYFPDSCRKRRSN